MEPTPDHDRLLSFVGEIHGYLDVGELHAGLLDALRRLVPSEWASLNAMGRDPGEVVFLAAPEPPARLTEPFTRLGQENPLVRRFLRTRDGRPYRFSDVTTREELHALELYREVYVHLGVEHQIAFVVQTAPEAFLAVALSRAESDYTDAERDVLAAARPAIIQAHRNAVAHTALAERRVTRGQARAGATVALREAGLTPREAEVVALLAVGHSVGSLAAELGIGVRTANKHLQSSYRKLGVEGKTQAAGVAWALQEG